MYQLQDQNHANMNCIGGYYVSGADLGGDIASLASDLLKHGFKTSSFRKTSSSPHYYINFPVLSTAGINEQLLPDQVSFYNIEPSLVEEYPLTVALFSFILLSMLVLIFAVLYYRRRKEKNYEATNLRMMQLLESMPDMAVVYDCDQRIIDIVNPQENVLLHLRVEDLIGVNMRDVIMQNDAFLKAGKLITKNVIHTGRTKEILVFEYEVPYNNKIYYAKARTVPYGDKGVITYVSILNGGMLGLSFYKKWGELPIVCFVATYLILLGYSSVGDLDLVENVQLWYLLIFSTLFYLMFLFPVVFIVQIDNRKINQLLMGVVVLNNFIFLLFGLWFLGEMRLEHTYNGVLTLFIALVNAAIAFVVQRKKTRPQILFTALTGLALTFITLTIPIQLEGTFITLFWASEMVIALWLFTKWRVRVYEIFSLILFFLTVVSYLIDVEGMIRGGTELALFANGTFTTGIFVGLALLVFALLLERGKELFRTTTLLKYSPFNAIALLAGSCVLYLAFMLDFSLNISDWYLSDGLMLVFTVSVSFLLLVLMRKRFPMERYLAVYSISLGISACWYLNTSLKLGGAIGGTVLQPLEWAALVILIGHLFFLSRQYYGFVNYASKRANGMTSYISILSTVLLALAVNNLLSQLSLDSETNAGFSISLSIAGFAQMAIGMRLHLKSLRIISLVTFGIVLLKLILIDLWLMPTIGKIIVFIILGVILLVLSFLYQKLKQVLFEKDRGE